VFWALVNCGLVNCPRQLVSEQTNHLFAENSCKGFTWYLTLT